MLMRTYTVRLLWIAQYSTYIVEFPVQYIVLYGFIKNELVSNSDPVVLRYSNWNDDADDVDENKLYGSLAIYWYRFHWERVYGWVSRSLDMSG